MPQDTKIFPAIVLAKSIDDNKPLWEHVLVIISQGTPTQFVYLLVQAYEELVGGAQFTPTLSLSISSQGTELRFAPPQQKAASFECFTRKERKLQFENGLGMRRLLKKSTEGPS